mmetsp:Transcript_19190/g.34704  ORF Transcript_19190/g.34704 Transcript_19190/m.34704 type:complete len:230 (+) Transcript_19190:354-1043(+)
MSVGCIGRGTSKRSSRWREDNVLHIIQNWIFEIVRDKLHRFLACIISISSRSCSCFPFDSLFLRGTIRLRNLAFHILHRILHENGTVRIALAHLLLPLLQSIQHVMTQYHRLVPPLRSIAIFPRQHVHLALIHAQLTNIRLQKKHVGALHQRIQYLRRCQIPLETAHDLTTLFDPRDIEPPCDIEHDGPVNVGVVGNLLARPSKLHIGQIHPRRLPNLNEILSHNHNLL